MASRESLQTVGSSQKGLTLLELVVVIAVLVALAGVSLDLLIRAADQTAHKTTVDRIRELEKCFLAYAERTVKCRFGNSAVREDVEHLGVINVTTPTLLYDPAVGVGLLDPDVHGYDPTKVAPACDTHLDLDESSEIVKDGWGNSFYYKSEALSWESEGGGQAIFYLISAGQDGVLEFDGLGDADPGDDVISALDARSIFNEEARARVAQINAALARYVRTNETLIPGTGYSDIYNALTAEPLSGYLPPPSVGSLLERFNPWRVDVGGNVGVDPFGGEYSYIPAGNEMPAGQVDFVAPSFGGFMLP